MHQTSLSVLLLLIACISNGFGDTYIPVIKRGPFVSDLKIGRNMVSAVHRLWGCEIVGQDLRDSSFDDCDLGVLHDCLIQSCKVDYLQLKKNSRSLLGASFHGVDFHGDLDFTDAVFGPRQLSAMNTEVVILSNATVFGLTTNLLNAKNIADTKSFKDGNLTNMTLYSCDFAGVDFSRQVLVDTCFSACKFDGCKFDDAVMSNTVFEECTGLTRAQFDSTWNSKAGRPQGVMRLKYNSSKAPGRR